MSYLTNRQLHHRSVHPALFRLARTYGTLRERWDRFWASRRQALKSGYQAGRYPGEPD